MDEKDILTKKEGFNTLCKYKQSGNTSVKVNSNLKYFFQILQNFVECLYQSVSVFWN